MNPSPVIAVTSPSFAHTPDLCADLLAAFPRARLNSGGKRLAGAELVAFLAGAEGAVIGLEQVDGALLDACPGLSMVAKYGVGLDNLDLDACRARGVAVGWTAGVNRRSVAEMTVGLMIGLTRNLFLTSRQLQGGVWNKNGGIQLSEGTVGLIGFGNIGTEVARLLCPFGCRVLANDLRDIAAACTETGAEPATKDQIYAEADIISLHVPLTELTRNLFDAATLARLRPGAFLINTARGGIVDQRALAMALKSGYLAGAALDVYDFEPPTDADLLGLPTLVATPHIGGNSREAVLAMGRSAIGHLRRHFLAPILAIGDQGFALVAPGV
ncbi:Hydroxyacid dehydrogenase [uncultured Gammaproteobacteria bacterium]